MTSDGTSNELISAERIFIEGFVKSLSSYEKHPLPCEMHEVFSGGLKRIKFSKSELNDRVENYKTWGDGGCHGEVFFTEDYKAVSNYLFCSDLGGEFQDELYSILEKTSPENRAGEIQNFIELYRDTFDEQDQELAYFIAGDVGGLNGVPLHDVVNGMFELDVKGDSEKFWCEAFELKSSLVDLVVYDGWGGNRSGLLCLAPGKVIHLLYVTS